MAYYKFLIFENQLTRNIFNTELHYPLADKSWTYTHRGKVEKDSLDNWAAMEQGDEEGGGGTWQPVDNWGGAPQPPDHQADWDRYTINYYTVLNRLYPRIFVAFILN